MKMGVHVIGLTMSGGIPLFTRHRGNVESLPFSLVASLNGVHMFSKSQNMIIESTQTQDSSVVWKDFADSITLIAIGSLTNDSSLQELLNGVFNAMVLCVGIDELKNMRNVERLKRDLRSCYPLIDRLLECLDLGDRPSVHVNLLSLVEVMMCEENLSLQNYLETFAEGLESLFACVMLENCVAVATAGWWELTTEERRLLSLVVSTATNNTAIDVPVFLPCKSPSVPFRLVSVCLINGVWVSALCGPTPDLSAVEHLAGKLWRPAVDTLRSALQTYPRNIPHTLQIHQGLLGLLLINCEVGKFVLSHGAVGNKKESRSPADVLRTFYLQTAIHLAKQDLKQRVIESYWCSEYHKLHALRSGNNLMCALYSSAVPTHTMRLITQHTLQMLVSDKQLCW